MCAGRRRKLRPCRYQSNDESGEADNKAKKRATYHIQIPSFSVLMQRHVDVDGKTSERPAGGKPIVPRRDMTQHRA
jgi:hypothetical protein